MAITFHPKRGQILVCDFTDGFKAPELVKNRPVLVITPPIVGRAGLVTVVGISSVEPNPMLPFHLRLARAHMPQLGAFQKADSWVKADMIYTVDFHRLNQILLNKRDPKTGKRAYFRRELPSALMAQIEECVMHGLAMGHRITTTDS